MSEFPLRYSESGGAMTLGYAKQGHPGPTGPTGPTGPAGAAAEYEFDALPTENSDKLVTSGGIFAALPCVETTASITVSAATAATGGALYQPQVNAAWLKLKMLDWFYPVGSIYTSTDSTSPETLFGGNWERIKDTFLLAAGDSYEAGATGGEAEHTLIHSEMPTHIHGGWVGYGTSTTGSTTTAAQMITGPADYKQVSSLSFSTSAGGSGAHNNMPPYLTVYMWKRVASVQVPMEG